MPFQKGQPRPAGAGRKKGTPNKHTAEVAEVLAEMGFDPIRTMVRIAKNPKASLELRGRMCSELAQFVYPKRKAIEVKPPDPSRGDFTLEELLDSWRRLDYGQ